MTVAFVQTVTPWFNFGTNSSTSASFTAGSGNALVAVCTNGSNATNSVSGSSSAFSILTPPGQHPDLGNDLDICVASLPCVGGSQTCTFSSTTAGRVGWLWEYSGVSTVTAAATDVASPGTGSGAIHGAAVVVPSGGILLAMCTDVFSTGVISSPTGTTRGSGTTAGGAVNYCATEYSGTGASITPSFTTASGSDSFVIFQWLLSPSGGGSSSITATAVAITVTGNTATASQATSDVIIPVSSWRRAGRLLVPQRKIFLPDYRKAA